MRPADVEAWILGGGLARANEAIRCDGVELRAFKAQDGWRLALSEIGATAAERHEGGRVPRRRRVETQESAE